MEFSHSETRKLKIWITWPYNLSMKVSVNGMTKRYELAVPDKIEEQDLFYMWFLKNINWTMDFMPYEVELHIGAELKNKMSRAINDFGNLLEATIDAVEQCSARCNQGNKTLFVNVAEDLRYKSLYSLILKYDPDCRYLNVNLGFDRETRTWKKLSDFMPYEGFMSYLEENQIGTIVTVNHYMVDYFRNTICVLLHPVLKRKGIRLITIDNDPHDLRPNGYFAKYAIDDRDWPRFSNLHCLSEYWDWHENRKICYVSIPQDYTEKPERVLRNDYKIVVLSNSRWESVQYIKPQIDMLFDSLERPWRDLTVWYMALRKIILDGDLTRFEKQTRASWAHQFFFVAAQNVKFQAIKALKTGREIEVYGDVGWKSVCPEYYRGSLNNEQIDRLFERDDVMILLANCSYTYMDASGPVYDMIRRGAFWINVPPVARTEELEGLRHIEYSDAEELNTLVNEIKPRFESAREGLKNYRGLLQESTMNIVREVTGSGFLSHVPFVQHADKIDEVVDEFIDENELLLRQSYRMFKF